MSTRSRSHSTLRQRSSERTSKLVKSNSASRNTSPAIPNRRVAKLNLYLSKSAKNSTDQLHLAPKMSPNSPPSTCVRRWDGNRRTTVKWDSVRRDPELWFPSGDCLIHFYERGYSRRGASLRVSLADIESSNCRPLLDRFFTNAAPESPISGPSSSESEKFSDSAESFTDSSPPAIYELYIPAPTHLSREEAFQHHLTTRNFFAWMFRKPLVGERLGAALVALLNRMNDFRPSEWQNEDELLAYIDSQGYTDFRDCPDHALAVLQFAEKFQNRKLWTDAFVHCAGMYDDLDSSAEFEYISHTSKALISRAHLEMDLRLERAGASLSEFLEDDLSAAYLGLGKEAQLHLERFRSFLHQFYVGKHGYWPPTELGRRSTSFPTSTYRSMYSEFRNLYAYMVDSTSSNSIQHNMPVDGGICVFQNIQAFDRRQKYVSLPHPLPLVPKIPTQLGHRKSLGKLNIFSHKQAKLDKRVGESAALCKATNPPDETAMKCSLVLQYLRFEKQWTLQGEGTVSCADARKVRWILIYAILQTLISVTRAPKEVRDTEGVSYPLCCQTGGTPPWQMSVKGRKTKPALQARRPTSLKELLLELGPDMDIVSAKPSPLLVPQKSFKTTSPPRRVSVRQDIPVRSPQPIRASSWEILNKNFGDVSPIDQHNDSPVFHGDISPIDYNNSSPVSDPTTPSTSEAGAGSGGWSASSSEDDMDHNSVHGSDSNYGDDEDEEQRGYTEKTQRLGSMKRNSAGSFRPGNCNPEVDQYIRS